MQGQHIFSKDELASDQSITKLNMDESESSISLTYKWVIPEFFKDRRSRKTCSFESERLAVSDVKSEFNFKCIKIRRKRISSKIKISAKFNEIKSFNYFHSF